MKWGGRGKIRPHPEGRGLLILYKLLRCLGFLAFILSVMHLFWRGRNLCVQLLLANIPDRFGIIFGIKVNFDISNSQAATVLTLQTLTN